MTKLVVEDADSENLCLTKYLNLDNNDFCCGELYSQLLGENNGKCELHFGYEPKFREYFIDVRAKYGGAVQLIKHCPWCGTKLLKGLRREWFDVLEKEYGIKVDIGGYKSSKEIPAEFKSDEWWKKRGL